MKNSGYKCSWGWSLLLLHLVLIVLLWGGPAAGAPAAAPEDQRPWAIYGSIVSEDGAQDGWVLFDRRGISCVHCPEGKISNARRIKYDGYVFPGLIDNHNHAHWNVLPQWRAAGGRTFRNRYEWIDGEEYKEKVRADYEKITSAHLLDTALKYAEIRALIGGTTLIQSTYSQPVPPFLVRNLDKTYEADSRIPDIGRIKPEELDRFREELATGKVRRIFLHIAEGKAGDPKSAEEFAVMESLGLARPGVVVIHGIALTRQDFRKMARAGMYLVWSPKSNEVLYKETARVLEALEEGVVVALAPDWTITGSDNVLEEIKVAHEYSRNRLGSKITPRQLFKMTTSDAAKVAGVEERLGRLAFGCAADLFLAPKLDADPFQSLVKTYPRHIHLIFIDGMPLYGEPGEMGKWVSADLLDKIAVENTEKALLLKRGPEDSQERYKEMEQKLKISFPSWPRSLKISLPGRPGAWAELEMQPSDRCPDKLPGNNPD